LAIKKPFYARDPPTGDRRGQPSHRQVRQPSTDSRRIRISLLPFETCEGTLKNVHCIVGFTAPPQSLGQKDEVVWGKVVVAARRGEGRRRLGPVVLADGFSAHL
jgi:hypothetical protein